MHIALMAYMPHQDTVLNLGDQLIGLGPCTVILQQEDFLVAADILV